MAEKRSRAAKIENDEERLIHNHIRGKKREVCALIDRLLAEIGDEERIRSAPLNQISSMVGTLIDKFGSDEKGDAEGNGLLQSLLSEFKEIK